MGLITITCGFQSIFTTFFRPKSISKGRKLYDSQHVSDVHEIIDGEKRTVTGKVLPQTRVNNPRYDVEIEFDIDRSILKSSCGCKAGRSKCGCKHVAAVCTYVNEERTVSKTDAPLQWDQPSNSQVKKYKKGCTIDTLFPPKMNTIDRSVDYRIDDVQNVPLECLQINALFSKYIETEKITKEERKISEEITEQRQQVLRKVMEQLYELQWGSHHVYKSYECLPQDDGLKVKIRELKCPDELLSQYMEVHVTKDERMKICIASEQQSNCLQWFSERFKRITSSTRAHRIKTRKDHFESLAGQFKNQKFDGKMTHAMAYGIKTEMIARQTFCNLTGFNVATVGLVIRIQPFLASSPDGIILDDKSLLEIKCPFSYKDGLILNREERTYNVPHLQFDSNGNVTLKQVHKYYTQVQVSMYVTGLDKCHFFVYSDIDSVHIEIARNDSFLREVIPKIELFYLKCFLPHSSSSVVHH